MNKEELYVGLLIKGGSGTIYEVLEINEWVYRRKVVSSPVNNIKPGEIMGSGFSNLKNFEIYDDPTQTGDWDKLFA